ncbi:MAG: DUF3592 domain-containing protein [Thermoanaerobaculia bacterium]
MRKTKGLWLFVLVSLGCFTPFVIQGWRDVRAFYLYEEGRCTILNLGSYETLGNKARNSTSPAPRRRHPELMYRVDAAGAHFFTFGFDNMNGRLSDMSEATAFRVGETYPCWYDPKHPERAILKRTVRPIFYAGATIPAFMLLVSGAMLRARTRRHRMRVTHGVLEPDITSRGRIRVGIALLLIWPPVALFGAYQLFVWQDKLWFFSALLIASVVLVVKRFVLHWRTRHLADPRVELDGARAMIAIDIPERLDKLLVESVRGEKRRTLFELENALGPVEQWVEVGKAETLVVTQKTRHGDIDTDFALH